MLGKAKYIGCLSKIHGIFGHLVFRIEDQIKLKKGDFVFLKIDGLQVPFFISDISQKDIASFIVQFDNYQTKILAEQLNNHEVYILYSHILSVKKPNEINQDIRDYKVMDTSKGELGKVRDLIDISDNPLIAIIYNKREVLIPNNENIVKGIDHASQTITVSLPEGLIDLFS